MMAGWLTRSPGNPGESAVHEPKARARVRVLADWVIVGLLSLLLTGCDQMQEQPRYDTYAPSDVYADGTSARPLPAGTVARGHLRIDTHLYEGMVDGKPATTFPFPITPVDLQRGREQFEIYCAICHGRAGDGNGMVPARGFTRPPSYSEQRLIDAPVGHFFDVITNGYGAMYGHNDRVKVEDRWRIAAYIRALQLSRSMKVTQLSQQERLLLPEGTQ